MKASVKKDSVSNSVNVRMYEVIVFVFNLVRDVRSLHLNDGDFSCNIQK